MKTRKKMIFARVLSFAFTLAICAFAFSSSSADAEESSSFSREVTEAVAPVLVNDYDRLTEEERIVQIDGLEGKLRKCAHAAEYFFMGVGAAVFALTFENARKRRAWLLTLCAMLFCVLFAASDELHQLAVPGRGGMLRDVLLDSLSAVSAVLIVRGGRESYRARQTTAPPVQSFSI